MTIIDITKHKLGKKSKWNGVMKSLENSDDPNGIIQLIMLIVIKECEIGLGLLEEGEDLDLHFFNEIHDVYQRAAGECYFCLDNDPNEIKFDKDTRVCIPCKKKLANFLKTIGIEPGRVLFGE